MGYSKNEQTVRRIEHLLEPIKSLPTGERMMWSPGQNMTLDQLAYKIREALTIARDHYPILFPVYAEFWKNNRIKQEGDMLVSVPRAAPLGASAGSQAVSQSPADAVALATSGRRPSSPDSAVVMGQQTAAMIAEHWMGLYPKHQKLVFMEARLSGEEQLKLYEWCQKRDLIFFEAAGTITLKIVDNPDERDLAFVPEDLDEQG